jgi:4-hydroxy-tetrahydrodipicolinate reductase
MTKVGLFGGTGRVGQRLVELLKSEDWAELSAIFVKKDETYENPNILVTNDIKEFLNNVDLVIDFSLPEATEILLEGVLEVGGKPLVIGTTGLNEHQQNLIVTASEQAPILYATNMSLGVALLNKLVGIASSSLRDFDIEIVEMHHRYKKDAPSGTALTLADTAAKARDLNLSDVRVSGRNGNIGARTKDEISVMALRGGDIVGKHTVGFYNDGEFIELNHTATSRDTFAKGAIFAGKWLVNQKNNLYTIQDCLNIQ